MKHFDVVVVGDYFFDLIYTGLPEMPVLGREIYSQEVTVAGGAMFITAASLRRLGVNVGWVGCFGNDYYSETVYHFALQEGIDLSLNIKADQPFRRVTTALPLHGERAFVTFADAPPVNMQEYRLETLQKCTFSHLHFGGLKAPEVMLPLIEIARQKGATVSTDCNDVPLLYTACDWKAVLSSVDIFMPNAREAMAVSGLSSVEQAARWLLQWVKIVVIKDGGNGAWVGFEDKFIHVPTLTRAHVVDTTGAGDCFNAGFLMGYVLEKAPVTVCAQYGNICGGLSVSAVGGATAAPTYDELKREFARDS